MCVSDCLALSLVCLPSCVEIERAVYKDVSPSRIALTHRRGLTSTHCRTCLAVLGSLGYMSPLAHIGEVVDALKACLLHVSLAQACRSV